jgi:hypothetical protein
MERSQLATAAGDVDRVPHLEHRLRRKLPRSSALHATLLGFITEGKPVAMVVRRVRVQSKTDANIGGNEQNLKWPPAGFEPVCEWRLRFCQQ